MAAPIDDVMELLALPLEENPSHTADHHRFWSQIGGKAYDGFARFESRESIRTVSKEDKCDLGWLELDDEHGITLKPLETTRKLKQILDHYEYEFVTRVLAEFSQRHHILTGLLVYRPEGRKMVIQGAIFYASNNRLIFGME